MYSIMAFIFPDILEQAFTGRSYVNKIKKKR